MRVFSLQQIAEWQKHYEGPEETAEEVEAENESEKQPQQKHYHGSPFYCGDQSCDQQFETQQSCENSWHFFPELLKYGAEEVLLF